MSRIRSIGTRTITGLALGTAAVALASPAFAAGVSVPTQNTGTLNSAPPIYATQAVTAANGALTMSANVNYVSPSATSTGSFLITFTLPTGVTFSGTPSATGTGSCPASSLPVTSGGNGGSSVTFTATVTASGSACTVALNSFLVNGATALETPTTQGFNVSEQVSGSSVTGVGNESTTTPIALAQSQSALVFYSNNGTAAAPSIAIDVNSPSLGTKFQQPIGGADQVLADLGSINYGLNSSALNATATGPYTLPASNMSITLTGNFTGIGSAYFDTGNAPFPTTPGASMCAPTASSEAGHTGALAGTVTANSITFTGVNGGGATNNPFVSGPSVRQEVCLYATGSNLIGANSLGFGGSGTVGSTTQALIQTPSPASALLGYNYNGVVQQLLYATAGTNYPGYVRIVNNGATTIKVFASVQADGGSVGTTTVESGLAPNTNDLVPVSTIASNAGVTLGPNARTSLTLFAPGSSMCSGAAGTCAVSFSLLEVNPSGDVVQLGSGTAP